MTKEFVIIYPNVRIGSDSVIEEFSIIGTPPNTKDQDKFETFIDCGAKIRTHTVIYAGNSIGRNFHTGNKANIREQCQIGDNVSIGALSVVEHHVKIGNLVRIHSQVFIPEYTIIEDNVWIGPNVVFTNSKYPNSPNSKKNLKGCYIKKNVIIGANCTILPGITISEKAVIGAGAVVTKDVKSKTVVAGNPAKIINNIDNLPYSI